MKSLQNLKLLFVYYIFFNVYIYRPLNVNNYNKCDISFFFSLPTEKEQQEAIEHIDEVQNEIDR